MQVSLYMSVPQHVGHSNHGIGLHVLHNSILESTDGESVFLKLHSSGRLLLSLVGI